MAREFGRARGACKARSANGVKVQGVLAALSAIHVRRASADTGANQKGAPTQTHSPEGHARH